MLLQLSQPGAPKSHPFSEPVPLGCNLHKCFSAFIPYFSASFFPCRLGSGKIVSLESKHMFRTTKCSGRISEWLLFPSSCWKVNIGGLYSQWEPDEAPESKTHKSVFSSQASPCSVQQLYIILLRISNSYWLHWWFLVVLNCDSLYRLSLVFWGQCLSCGLNSLMPLRRFVDFQFFQLFVVVRMGGLSSSLYIVPKSKSC